MNRFVQFAAAAVITLSGAVTYVYADEATPPSAPSESKHQLMKECMAKEKAGDVQMTPEQRAQVKKTCRDVSKTEEENEHAEKAAEERPTPAQ